MARAGSGTRTTIRATQRGRSPRRWTPPRTPPASGRLQRNVGRQQLDDGRPQLRPERRLQPRGQDPARRLAIGGGADLEPADGQRGDEHDRPAAHRPEHHAVRRGQHGRRRHDDAASHRPEHAARAVERHRWRAGRSVPWGHVYIPGYTPPAGRSTTPATPNVSHPNLDGVLSPQTIYQSATDGVPISGRNPAPDEDSISIEKVKLTKLPPPPHGHGPPPLTPPLKVGQLKATGPGTAHIFLWRAITPTFRCSSRAAGWRTIRRRTTASRRAR